MSTVMKDEVSRFLQSLLEMKEKISPHDQEKHLLEDDGLVDVVYRRLTSTKFRKSKVGEDTEKTVRSYLRKAVGKNEPLRLYFLFGGYKQSRLASFPYPEWAEIFNVNFILQAASYLESIYEPGVDVIYRGDELYMAILNNYQQSDIDLYTERFRKILGVFGANIPEDRKISLRYELTKETSPRDVLWPLMEKKYPEIKDWFDHLDRDVQEQRITKSFRNINWTGVEDFSGLSEDEKRAKAKEVYLMYESFLRADVEYAKEYFDNGVSVIFRSGVPGCVHYGGCATSTAQTMAGEGYLEKRGERSIPWIYSYEQIQTLDQHTVRRVEVEGFGEVGLETIPVVTKSIQ